MGGADQGGGADTKAARVAYDRFTTEHLVDLVREREAGDVQAVVDLDDALAGVERAVRTLHARAAAHGDLMRGVNGSTCGVSSRATTT